MSLRFHGKTFIPASPAKIFPLISTADGFTKWLLRKCELDAKPGGRFYMEWAGNYSATAEVVEIIADQKFSFQWTLSSINVTTRIAIWLEEVDNQGTILHIEEGDYPETIDAAKVWQEITQGWSGFLMVIKSVVMNGVDLRNDWD